MNEWFTTAQLAGLPGMPGTRYRVGVRAQAEGWRSRIRDGRGGGLEYHLESLPEETRAHLFVHPLPEAPASLAAAAGRAEGKKLRLQADIDAAIEWAARQRGLAAVGGLTGKRRDRLDARMAVMRAAREFCTAHGGSVSDALTEFSARFNAGEIRIDEDLQGEIRSVSPQTLWRWQKVLRTEGAVGLTGDYGKRKGASLIDGNPAMVEVLLGMLHDHPHTHARNLHRALQVRFPGQKLPSLRRLRAWIERWKTQNAQLFTAIKNPDEWRNKYRAAGGNASAHVLRLNQLWEMDSTPTDVVLADGRRHAIIGIIDVWPRRLKLLVAPTSKSSAIGALIRRCLMDWGVPETAKTDNGADYASRYIADLFAALEVKHELCPPFSPERKPHIERVLGRFSHDLVELLPGYVGHSVADRQAIRARVSFADRLMTRGAEPPTLNMTAEQLQAFCDQWCASLYANEVHGTLGCTPLEKVASWTGPIRRVDDERALDVLLLPAPGDGGWRTVTKKGIRVGGGNYDHQALGGLEGQRVFVRLDETEFGYLYLFREDGSFLCRAYDPARLGISHAEVTKARQAMQNKEQAEGKRVLREAAKRHKTKDIAQEILEQRVEQAANVALFPKPAIPHSTDALRAAGEAARVNDTPKPAASSDGDQAALEALRAEFAAARKPALVVATPDDPRRRYERWVRLDRRTQRGDAITRDEENFLMSYQKSGEWKEMRSFFDEFGLDVADL